MTEEDQTARNRYFLIVLARIVPTAGAIFGIVLLGRAITLEQKIIGVGIIVAALAVMATLPRSLAHKWRTPDGL